MFLRYCMVVDRNRHDIDETVQRKWSKGVSDAVIYCTLIATLVWTCYIKGDRLSPEHVSVVDCL
jgi:hypothetical protein